MACDSFSNTLCCFLYPKHEDNRSYASGSSCLSHWITQRDEHLPIFRGLIDVALQNAWYLSCKNGKISALNFRREIMKIYLSKDEMPTKRPRRISLSRTVRPDIRFVLIENFVVSCNRRCSAAECISFGRIIYQSFTCFLLKQYQQIFLKAL